MNELELELDNGVLKLCHEKGKASLHYSAKEAIYYAPRNQIFAKSCCSRKIWNTLEAVFYYNLMNNKTFS